MGKANDTFFSKKNAYKHPINYLFLVILQL